MKNPRDWDVEYLLNLPTGEHDWIEVKGRLAVDLSLSTVKEHDVRENLSRAISAFANRGGGVLVLGLRNPETGWEVDDGGVNLTIKRPSTREWLEDVIPNCVDPPLTAFNVYVFSKRTKALKVADGRGIFVIEVKESGQAPHQARDNRYYVRIAGKSRPIGHRLVADIFNRRQYPLIELEMQFNVTSKKVTVPHGGSNPVLAKLLEDKILREAELVVTAKNAGRVYANYVKVEIYRPQNLTLYNTAAKLLLQGSREFSEIDGRKYAIWNETNAQQDIISVQSGDSPAQYGPKRYEPLLPGLTQAWGIRVPNHLGREKAEPEAKLMWKVYADNAPVRSGSILVQDIPVREK